MHIKPAQFHKLILQWFATQGRKNLPWQNPRSSYYVWLSEIMLQQTQVSTVIPYFERFIKQFPHLKDLAHADINDVLALWAGLGYYSRARNLHRTAQIIQQDYAGEFPTDNESLQKLPGIGRSTAGAILSLSQNQSAAILDGNVKRVLARLHKVDGYPGIHAVQQQLWQLAEYYMPRNHAADYTQAMMDLGALICVPRQPKCYACPLNAVCLATKTGEQEFYPAKKARKQLPIKATRLILLNNTQHQWLLEKRPPIGIWGGLWSIPECPIDADISEWCKTNYFCEIAEIESLAPFRHTFSHFHLDISPVKVNVVKSFTVAQDMPDRIWCELKDIIPKGLPAPIKKIFLQLQK